MKLIRITLLVVLLMATDHTYGRYELSLGSLLRDMTSVGSEELDAVFENAQKSATALDQQILESNQRLQKNLEEKTSRLKEQAEEEALERKRQAEKESRRIFQRYEQQANMLQQQVRKDSAKITGKAMEKLLHIISQAEAEALKIKTQKRQKKLEQAIKAIQTGEVKTKTKLSSTSFIDIPRWKKVISEEFLENMKYLENIISKGENPEEAEDFLEVFEDQKAWFSDTLRDMKDSNDARYHQLMSKKKALDNVVDSHRNALSFLKKQLAKVESPPPLTTKMHLLTLYEVNYVLQEKSGNGIKKTAKTHLTSDDLNIVANRVMQKMLPEATFQKYQDTTPTGKVSLMTKEMTQRELDRALKKQQKAEKKLAQLEKDKKTFEKKMKKQLELTTAEKLELEIENKLLTRRIDETKKELALRQKEVTDIKSSSQEMKRRLVKDLENITQEKLELETIILDNKNKLLLSQKEVDETKNNLQTAKSLLKSEQKKRIHAEKKATEALTQVDLINELAERKNVTVTRKIKDYENQFTEKQKTFDLKKKHIAEKENLLNQRNQWLDNLSKTLSEDYENASQSSDKIEKNNRQQLEEELNNRIKRQKKNTKNKDPFSFNR